MTEKSMLWTAAAGSGDGAAAYTEAETTRLFRRLVTGVDNEGVLKDPDEEFGASGSNELAVSGTSSPVDVEAGDAWCHGYYYWNTAVENVAIPTPSAATRIDRIVLRATFADDEVRITRIAGTEGAGAPSLTQNATYWDIPLAQCSITTGGVITVTDEREFCHFNTLVGAGMIDDGAVDTDQLATSAVTAAKIAAGAVDTSELAADAVTGAKIADDQINSEHYVDGSIDTAHIGDLQVTNAKLGADAVTGDKIADDQIDSEHYVDSSIDTAHLAPNCVDDTRAGSRVPQLYRRQGGNSSIWNTVGSTTYTPGAVRMQPGVYQASLGIGVGTYTHAITFPVAFSNIPLVFVSNMGFGGTQQGDVSIWVSDVTASGFNLRVTRDDSSVAVTIEMVWLAMGPE